MDQTDTRRLVSVRLSAAGRGRLFLLDETGDPPSPGTPVVVPSDFGPALGRVEAVPATLYERRRPHDPPRPVVRRATEADVLERLKHRQREEDARRFAIARIRIRGLDMKLSRVEQVFDNSKLVFYFTADGRIDFRELVRDLAARYRTRIEMRQIGVRDEAKMLGGYGSCGRPLCCTTWLTSFEPVSIRMAKQQRLTLNPSKLSGLCGRLKCCLRYELPNAKGVKGGGCSEHGGCSNPSGPGTGGTCADCGGCH